MKRCMISVMLIGVLTSLFSAEISGLLFEKQEVLYLIDSERPKISTQNDKPFLANPTLLEVYEEELSFDEMPLFVTIAYDSSEDEITGYTRRQLEKNVVFEAINRDSEHFKVDFFAFSEEENWWAQAIHWHWFILCDTKNEQTHVYNTASLEQTEDGFAYSQDSRITGERIDSKAMFTRQKANHYAAQIRIGEKTYTGKAEYFPNHQEADLQTSIYAPTHRIDVKVFGEPYLNSVGVLKIEDFGESFFPFTGSLENLDIVYLNDDSMQEIVLHYSQGMGNYSQLMILEKMHNTWKKLSLPEPPKIATREFSGHDTYKIESGKIIRDMPNRPSTFLDNSFTTRVEYQYNGNGEWDYTITKH